MKNCMLMAGAMVLFVGATAMGQVGMVPITTPHEYVIASSPVGDGRTITTYYSPENPVPLTQLAPPAARQVFYRSPAQVTPAASVAPVQYYGSTTPIGSYHMVRRPTFAASPVTASPVAVSRAGGCGSYSPYPAANYAPTLTNAYSSGYQYRPVVPVHNLPSNAYLGQGLLGQPKAYVNGQPIRNFLRYMSP